MPPRRRPARRGGRRSHNLLPVLFITIAAMAVGLFISCTASSTRKQATNTSRGSRQSSPAPPPSAATPRSRPGPGGLATPPAGFALASPTPVATCAPEELQRLVTKDYALPAEYVPPDLVTLQPIDASPRAVTTLKLRREAADALHRMLDQARMSNLSVVAQSAYRSYQDQAKVYQDEVQLFGQAQADRESARPGHSEHQLGTAVDLSSKRLNYDLNDSFAATPEGKWLQQNAVQYGYVLSYPEGKESATGYTYEPWHYRYIGVEPAREFAMSGQSLTEWLGPRQLGCQP